MFLLNPLILMDLGFGLENCFVGNFGAFGINLKSFH